MASFYGKRRIKPIVSEHRIAQIVRRVLNEEHYDYNEGEDFHPNGYEKTYVTPREHLSDTVKRIEENGMDEEALEETDPALSELLGLTYRIEVEEDSEYPDFIDVDGLEDTIKRVKDKDAHKEIKSWFDYCKENPAQFLWER